MKKLTSVLLATTLVLSVSASALATEETPVGEPPMMQTQMPELTEEMLAELEALAEAAGMTLEEYMATMMPELEEGTEPGMGQGMMPELEEGTEPGMGQGMRPGLEEETLVLATATSSTVYVDGVQVAFEAYNIDGSNYFKLRDLSAVVSGSEKQFDVSWDGDLNAINLISGSSYTSVGGELAAGDGTDKEYTATTSAIYVDGVETVFEAYNIDGNNYFKLRDVCSAFDVGVTWNGDTNSIELDTSISYTE